MGLFSSEVVTTVGASVQRVIKDEDLPNSVRTGILRSMIGNQAGKFSASEMILEEVSGSIAVKADRMYRYGKTLYAHGVPSAQLLSASQGRTEVEAILEDLEGTEIAIQYSNVGPPNALHLGWMRLVSEYGYNSLTNELAVLTASKGRTVYLGDMAVLAPLSAMDTYRVGVLDFWGQSPQSGWTPARTTAATIGKLMPFTPVEATALVSSKTIRLTAVWADYTTLPVSEDITFSLDGLADETADYFHVQYSLADGTRKWWMYKVGEGTYPELDELFQTAPSPTGTFLPITYFRFNKQSDNAVTTTPAYLTGKKMAKYLGMDYDSVANAINENPDIADVQQAMIMFAVPANTTDPLEMEYLYEFFNNLFSARAFKYRTPVVGDVAATQANDPNLNTHALVIEDERFKMTLVDQGIFKRMVHGTIGDVGEFEHEVTTTWKTRTFDVEGVAVNQDYEVKVHNYRKQVSLGLYEEIQVVGLEMQYYAAEYTAAIADEEDTFLLIPIDRSITHEKFNILEREKLYARSLHWVFVSLVYTKLAWYQQDFFQFVLLVVAIAVSIYSLGESLAALSQALSTGTTAVIQAAALDLVKQLLVRLVIAEAFQLFVKAVGFETAFLLAVVSALSAGILYIESGSFTGVPWAKDLLALSNGLTRAAESVLKERIDDLLEDYKSFVRQVEEETKTLETSRELLENRSLLSPFVIFGETPDEYYNRTVHAGNIGTLGIVAVSDYVQSSLALPRYGVLNGIPNFQG
jgi:hypothetical protein